LVERIMIVHGAIFARLTPPVDSQIECIRLGMQERARRTFHADCCNAACRIGGRPAVLQAAGQPNALTAVRQLNGLTEVLLF
jgi:hypothetical protein